MYTIKLWLILVVLGAASALLAAAAYHNTFLQVSLLDKEALVKPFGLVTKSDRQAGFSTVSSAVLGEGRMVFDFTLAGDAPFSYAVAEFLYGGESPAQGSVDLSSFSKVTLQIQCQPATHLHFYIATEHPKNRMQRQEGATYPQVEKQFFCGDVLTNIDIDFGELGIPVWWLRHRGLEFAEVHHDFTQTVALGVGSTRHTALQEPTKVTIRTLELLGRSWSHALIPAGLLLALLLFTGGMTLFAMRRRSAAQAHLKERPKTSTEALAFRSKGEIERESLLNLLATEFHNPDLTLEGVAHRTGLNRNKVNAILKQRLDMTFSAYLNHLRLSESARLLSRSDPSVCVSEIAFSVGYNNASYFSKLFKQHFGCSPKTYRSKHAVTRSS